MESGQRTGTDSSAWLLLAVGGALWVLALSAIYQISFYLRLPADLLSFSESPFITDILKLELGEPLYTPPADNNSYPYTPGTQLLTYGIARLFGAGTSIPALRIVQAGYVVAAALVGTVIAHRLARPDVRSGRGAWRWWFLWLPVLVLVAFDPRVNLYTHSLHNDGLALLLSALAFWLLVMADGTRRWPLVLSALLPAAGYLVKQSLLIWLILGAIYLWSSRVLTWRQTAVWAAASSALVMGTIALCYGIWGENFAWWVFEALGGKSPSPLRSALHLLESGGYLALGLLGAVLLWGEGARRREWALAGTWLLLLLAESFTSGIAWVSNHLGPGALLAVCLFLASLPRVWNRVTAPGRRNLLHQGVFAAVLLCVPGALGLIRVPADPVPPDFHRYVAEIEREFVGLDASDVLLDNGTWVYLREGDLVKDRSSPVALHVGANQAEVRREAIAGTIDRIRSRRYRKILARELYSERFPYDFQNRGSGIREALLENYRDVGRIDAVRGVDRWWPKNLLSEIVVLEPRDVSASPGDERDGEEG